jgi:predicted metal-dependent enzyme (double-stranded beta helix superfamily)
MLLRELEALLGAAPAWMRPEELFALGAGWPAALDVVSLANRARFSDQGYTRTPLHRSAGWEVLLVGWLPGQRTAPHGHGESWLTCVLEGTLARWSTGLPGAEGDEGRATEAPRGRVFHEEPHTIHHVEHAGRTRAVSLHLYAPPLARMELYEGSTGTSHPRGSGRREPKSSIMAR